MVKNCCAVGCSNVYRKGSGVKFYRFPSDPERKAKWIAAVRRENWTPTEYTWICSQHFVTGEKSNNPLAPNYVPSLFEYVDSPVKRRLEGGMDKFHRRQAMKKRRTIIVEERSVAVCSDTVSEGNENEIPASIQAVDDNEETDSSSDEAQILTVEDRDNLLPIITEQETEQDAEIEDEDFGQAVNPLYKDCESKLLEATEQLSCTEHLLSEATEQLSCTEHLLSEATERLAETTDQLTYTKSQLLTTNNKLAETKELLAEAKLESSSMQKKCTTLYSRYMKLSTKVISEDLLAQDDKMVKYYTGLPSYEVLKAVYNLVVIGIPSTFSASSCSLFQQFLTVLMKLRLNLGDQDIAYRFAVSQSTASRYFNKWLDILYHKLSVFVSWPEREQLLKTMPAEFRKTFAKCAIIIDCFEVFTERPTSLKARAQTWSNYKKHNTVKFLIGVTPQGTIGFISKGWGGRVSDIYITENSGLLHHLLPGDIVLADRGFNIQEAAGMYCAEVKLPPFTKGKKQLSQMEIDVARKLSRVRIYVERVIGVVRQKYTILQSTLPINMIIMSEEDSDISSVDKIVTVACALCNHCDSVIPFD